MVEQKTNRQARRALGRGLGAIFQETMVDNNRPKPAVFSENKQEAQGNTPKGEGEKSFIKFVDVNRLEPGQLQPRRIFNKELIDELAESVRNKGVLEPLIVRAVDGSENYEIIAGERRWRASIVAELEQVPVIIKELSDVEALEISLVENIQRENLTHLEEAWAYQQLIQEFSYTQENLGKTLGKSRSHITNIIRLLKLPESVQQMMNENLLSYGHARAIIALENPEDIAKIIIDKGLNVRQTEKLVADMAKSQDKEAVAPKASKRVAHQSSEIQHLEEAVEDSIGLSVSIKYMNDGTGFVKIQYENIEQLDDVCRKLQA